jgi:glycosyltransferase involved in cell wall biosynthesis
MNILFVDQFSDPGGAQLALLDILEAAVGRGWNVRTMVPGFGALAQRASARGIPVDRLSLRAMTNGSKNVIDTVRYLHDLPQVRLEIRRAIAQHRIDLLYVNGPRLLPAVFGFDIPLIFHAHSFVNGGIPRALAIHSLKGTNAALIAASRFASSTFEHAARYGTYIIYNGAPDFLQYRPREHTGPVRLGIVGRLSPFKGQLDFVRAVQSLHSEDASFTIYGDSFYSEPEYEARVRALASGTAVRFEPWRDDVGSIYRELDILAVPSLSNEVSTRVIMEAFSAGVAVVAYPSGGIPEIVDHERTGLLTAHADCAELAQFLQRLMRNPQLRNSLITAAHAEWDQRFTKQRFQNAVCDVIEATHSNHGSTFPINVQYRRDRTPSGAHARR